MDLLTIEAFLTLFMLILLQAVLGFDNLLYIAIESNKVGNAKDAKKSSAAWHRYCCCISNFIIVL